MQGFVLAAESCVVLHPFPGVTMKASHGDRMTLSLVLMEPGSVIEEHAHPHEQMGYMIEGEAEFVIGGQTFHVRAGHMWRIPGGVPHRVKALSRMLALDAFCPPREDMSRPDSWGKIAKDVA
ncbi:MAG: cupin domain-containing protein [Thermoguttaceae bacterium]|nr:cupin domain-containing protein [Thermoguttaceae bacterium]MDW8077849.1 cupin domain-containing protein [Thermoguttaceae bacterium]